MLTAAAPVPGDAEDHLAQIRWFLQAFAGDGAALTVNKPWAGHCSPRPATGLTG